MEKIEKRQKMIEASSLASSIISGLILLIIASFYNDIKSIPVLVYRIQDQKEVIMLHEQRITALEKKLYAKN